MRDAGNDGQFLALKSEGSSSILGLLKACTKQKDLDRGSKLHAYIRKHSWLVNDCYIASSLVSMYARCGALGKAQEAFKDLRVRDVVVWNALIAGYAQQNQGEEALKCYDSMQREGHSPDVITFTCALKACGSIGAVAKGERIHEKIGILGMLDKDALLGNTLVDMYARCGAFAKAQQVLNELSVRNAVTWNALIARYVDHGKGEEALKCFEGMQREGYSPNGVTYISALKACGIVRAVAKGEEIHDQIVSFGMLKKDFILGNALVDMYARCGAVAKAQLVLKELPTRDVVTWTSLIAGYVQESQFEEALKCFDDMQREGHSPDAVTFICALKACGSMKAAGKGEKLHEKIINLGTLKKDVVLGNALMDMYFRCGAPRKAQQVFDDLPVRDVVMWTTLIAGCTEHGKGVEALKYFDNMQSEGHPPNTVTFAYVLKACASIGAATKGEEIYYNIVSLGMLENDVLLGSSLVDMYARCGALAKAQEVLNELPFRDAIAWTALIAGYVQQGQGREALKCLDNMEHEGHCPNAVTFVYALKACGSIGAVSKGEKIHDKIVSLCVLEKDIVLGGALVDMYVRCGAVTKAQKVLDELLVHDVVMWNALMSGYAQQGQGEEALKCFDRMECEGQSPDVVTFACALKACGSIGATTKGKQIHDNILILGLLKKYFVLGSALVDMYAKCAALPNAVEVLEQLPVQVVVAWNAVIGGYAQLGQSVEALKYFEKMQSKGTRPDSSSLVCVLNACCHSGLLDKAEMYFLIMTTEYTITPDVDHYCCMLDLFGRAGMLDKALEMIEKIPIADYLPAWQALLGACSNLGDVRIGRLVFERVSALYISKNDTTAYIVMANIYAAAGMQEDACRIEVMSQKTRHCVENASHNLIVNLR